MYDIYECSIWRHIHQGDPIGCNFLRSGYSAAKLGCSSNISIELQNCIMVRHHWHLLEHMKAPFLSAFSTHSFGLFKLFWELFYSSCMSLSNIQNLGFMILSFFFKCFFQFCNFLLTLCPKKQSTWQKMWACSAFITAFIFYLLFFVLYISVDCYY